MMAEKENGTMKGFFSFWLKLGEKCVDENDPIIKEELLEEYIKREKRCFSCTSANKMAKSRALHSRKLGVVLAGYVTLGR